MCANECEFVCERVLMSVCMCEQACARVHECVCECVHVSVYAYCVCV